MLDIYIIQDPEDGDTENMDTEQLKADTDDVSTKQVRNLVPST